MFETPELYDDPAGSLAVDMCEDWPEIPDDPVSQASLLQDANQARDRHLEKLKGMPSQQAAGSDTAPADVWSTPKYVEPDRDTKSTREQRTTMALDMKFNVPCAYCSSFFPEEVLEYCDSCVKLYCHDCIGDGRLCKNCRPVLGWPA